MAENNEKSIEERLKDLRATVKAGIELEKPGSEPEDEMIEQTRQKFKRLRKRV